jgi:uncharacterized membrane protein YqaE (UPF0057 family)
VKKDLILVVGIAVAAKISPLAVVVTKGFCPTFIVV